MASYHTGGPGPVISTMHYLGLSGKNHEGNTVSGSYDLGPGLYTLVVGGANEKDAKNLLAATKAMTTEDWLSYRCSPHPCTPTAPSPNAQAYMAQRLPRNFHIDFQVSPTHRDNFNYLQSQASPSPVPIPAAAWLFGSGLAGVAALARRRKS